MDGSVIINELEKLSRAIGTPLHQNRLAQYVEDLSGLDEKVFIEVCNDLRRSWERASFPPIGAFLNRAREKSSVNYSSNGISRQHIDPRYIEAARRQEEYLKMSHSEYMALCLRMVRERES